MAQRIQRRTFLAGIGAVAGASVFGRARVLSTESDLQTLSDWLRASAVAREAGVQRCLERIRAMDASIQAWVQVLPQTPLAAGLWQALGRSPGQEEEFTIGVPDPFPAVEPEMAKACEQVVARLRRSGVPTRRVDISKTLVELDSAQHVVSFYEGAREHRARFEQYGDRLGQLADLVREGLQISDVTYATTKRFIADTRARFTEMYQTAQVVLVPAATGPAPAGLSSTGDRRMNSPWSALGSPAISIPIPVGSSLPLGLQLTAALGDDAKLLQAAARIAKLL